MTGIKAGIYQIVNVRDGTAISVLAHHILTICGWEMPNGPGQHWLLQVSQGKYQIVDCGFGRYIVADSANCGAKVNIGIYPTSWEILPVKEETYVIKLPGHDLVFASEGGRNGIGIHLWPQNLINSERAWRFEQIWDIPDDELGVVRFETAEEKGAMAQRIDNQKREIKDMKKRLEEGDQKLTYADGKIKYLLCQLVCREGPPYPDRAAGAGDTFVGGSVHEELHSLKDRVKQLERLIAKPVEEGEPKTE